VIKPDKRQIFNIINQSGFHKAALGVFQYQSLNNPVYAGFLKALNIIPDQVKKVESIPFLPIEFFKNHPVVNSPSDPADVVFTSSGTTGMATSRHIVTDVSWYIKSFRRAFSLFYGDVRQYCILALLPSYLERDGSSLIYMANDLIKQSGNVNSGFFLYNYDALYQTLKKQQQNGMPTLLIGVTFALLDFVDNFQLDFPELIVMETGGMKGRRKEMIREELHSLLTKGFGVKAIHSEYGMTELLSQAYSKGMGIFNCPPWMKIITRDTNDPLTLLPNNKTGGVNVIDLANVNSCAFIATQDLGTVHENGEFEILGRFDHADVRGCNLLVS
jgi:hypothetical protein